MKSFLFHSENPIGFSGEPCALETLQEQDSSLTCLNFC